jgi:hypothetical protein
MGNNHILEPISPFGVIRHEPTKLRDVQAATNSQAILCILGILGRKQIDAEAIKHRGKNQLKDKSTSPHALR